MSDDVSRGCECTSCTASSRCAGEDAPVGPYMDYDPLGGLCLFGEVLTDE